MNNIKLNPATYGFGLLTIVLISRWSTGNAIFVSPAGLLRFGFIEVISYSTAGFLAFLSLLPIALKVRHSKRKNSPLEFIKDRLSEPSYKWMKRILLLGVFFEMTILSFGASILLSTLKIPVPWGMSLFLFCGFILAIFLRLKWFTRFSMLKVGILFLVLIMVLVHAYMPEGIEVVYNGIRLYHPYLLYIDWSKLPFLLLVFWSAMFGNILLDLKTWSLLLKSRRNKLKLSIITTGVIWGVIPFSFSMIAISSIYKGGFNGLFSVFEKVLLRYDYISISILLIFILLLILFETFLTTLQTLYFLYEKNERKLNRHIFFIIPLFVMVIPFVINLFSLTILNLFFIFGVFFAGAVPVMAALFWRNEQQGLFPICVIGVSAIAGWSALFLQVGPGSVVVSFAVSTVLVVLGIVGKRSSL